MDVRTNMMMHEDKEEEEEQQQHRPQQDSVDVNDEDLESVLSDLHNPSSGPLSLTSLASLPLPPPLPHPLPLLHPPISFVQYVPDGHKHIYPDLTTHTIAPSPDVKPASTIQAKRPRATRTATSTAKRTYTNAMDRAIEIVERYRQRGNRIPRLLSSNLDDPARSQVTCRSVCAHA